MAVQQQYKAPRAVVAASGYKQYSGNLTHPVMSDRLIARFYNETVLSRITTTTYYDPIRSQGDTVRFFREPRATVQGYNKDGYIKPETLSAETFSLHINQALAYSLKVDCIDEYQMQMWPRFREGYLKNVTRVMANTIERQIMAQAVLNAHPRNQGQSAGCVCGSINLGTRGAPVLLTARNVLIKLAEMGVVLDEQEVPMEGRYVLMPYCAKPLLMAALGSAAFTGQSNSAFVGNGISLANLTGFDIIFTPNIASARENGKQTFHMMFGHKDATAFATQIVKTKTAETVENFDTYIMGLQVYGFGVPLPEALGNLYACIDPTPEILCC